jgi:prolyl-tRNA editing enzyme YbaK/EbsC (Cys-tRNA(Pro) deacylase)
VRTSVDVHTFLIERDVPHEVFLTTGRLRSPERLAAVLDLPERDVGRVVVYESAEGGPVAAVVPVGAVPDPDAVRQAAATGPLHPASQTRASELSGYLAESIPPAGLPVPFRVVVDASLDRDAVLYFPGGEVRSVLKVRGSDLVRATRASVGPVAAKPPDNGAGDRAAAPPEARTETRAR